MIYKLQDNRVRRSYKAGGVINDYTAPASLDKPEDWIASCVKAFNPGMEPVPDEGLSRLDNGGFLKDELEKTGYDALGEKNLRASGARVSILVKLLDAGERLFLQCHPTDEFAREAFSSPVGKTECWYIVSAQPEACVYLGFKEGITREKWQQAFDAQDVSAMLSMLHRLRVKKGDVVFVSGGMPHAIGKGCFIVELQQPTDLMVIPERTGETGRTLPDEKMHGGLGFDRMMDCFTFEGMNESELRERFVRSVPEGCRGLFPVVGEDLTDQFRMDQLTFENSFTQENVAGTYRVVCVLEGTGTVSDGKTVYPFSKGDKFFVCADTEKLCWTGDRVTVVQCRP